MHVHDFVLQFMIILLAARVLGEAVTRLKIPSVIGELMAGIILGPSILGWLSLQETIKMLAEIGIILLLFEVGIETDVSKLFKTGIKPLIVAIAGFITPFALGFAISFYSFQLSLLTSLFVGGTLTATSIGITVRVLTDLKKQHSQEAQIVLGAAVLDDVLGVVLLAILYQFSSAGTINVGASGKVMLFITIFLVLAPVAAKLISAIIKHFEATSEIPGLLPTMIVALLLFFAWIAHYVGAPEILGGFAAGLAVSRYFSIPYLKYMSSDESFTHRIEEQMKPIVHLFTPIFFVSVGLSLNLKAIDWTSGFIWALSIALLAAAVGGKMIGGFLIRENRKTKWAIGLAMIPRGEVGLIFAELGRTTGIIDSTVYAALIIVIALTTLLPPLAMRWYYGEKDKLPP